MNGSWEGVLQRSVPDAGTVGEFWVARDPGRAGESREVVVLPGDLAQRVPLDPDERAFVAEGYRPASQPTGSPHSGEIRAGYGVESLRGGGERGAELTVDMEQPGVVLVDSSGGTDDFEDLDRFR